jgi:hypothetical protein
MDAGDFNEDGNMDFMVVDYNYSVRPGPHPVHLYAGNGDGTFTDRRAFTNLNIGYGGKHGDTVSLAAGDFNSDGYLYVIVVQDDGDPGQTWLYKGDGTGQFSYFGEAYDVAPTIEEGNNMQGWGYADAYNFDGNGELDVIASAEEIGYLFIKGNGDGTFQPPIKIDEYIGRAIAAPSYLALPTTPTPTPKITLSKSASPSTIHKS